MIVEFTDFKNSISWAAELTDQDEIFLNDVWFKEDVLLVGLSDTAPFEGKTTWSDLEMLHYQILFFRCFEHLDAGVQMDELTLRLKEPFLTFKFFASCVSKLARTEGIQGFDAIRVMREESNRIIISFNKSFEFDWDRYTPETKRVPTKFPFRVIVDNTKGTKL
jgi:hypothetical protein